MSQYKSQYKVNKNPLQKEENLVTQLISKYIMFWPLFVVFFALAVGSAYMYLRYATPMFEATATLIIKDEKKGADDSKGIPLTKQLFKTSPLFNICSFAIMLILVVVYAAFWK